MYLYSPIKINLQKHITYISLPQLKSKPLTSLP
nr:MAG TPA: hypothetical protein [Caudoviricetes sp.]